MEFSAAAGSHILHLLRGLKMPVVTTLHTVLREPDPDQLAVMNEIAELSDRLIVMSQLSSQFLREIFKVPGSKIDMVPHGVPDLPFLDPNFYKDRFGVEGKAVLLTFGLLSPNKGIENVIQALPQILSKHTNVAYIVAGATHPHILRREGDKYRASLQALAKEVGVESQVIFHDRFVSPEEMVGSLARPIFTSLRIATRHRWFPGRSPMRWGREGDHFDSVLARDRVAGRSTRRSRPFQNPALSRRKTIELLNTPLHVMPCANEPTCSRAKWIWKTSGTRLHGKFYPGAASAWKLREFSSPLATLKTLYQLPELKLNHVITLTDDTGILQHAIFTIPNRAEADTTDRDNARACILTVLLDRLGIDQAGKTGSANPDWPFRYLAFLEHAFNPEKTVPQLPRL